MKPYENPRENVKFLYRTWSKIEITYSENEATRRAALANGENCSLMRTVQNKITVMFPSLKI